MKIHLLMGQKERTGLCGHRKSILTSSFLFPNSRNKLWLWEGIRINKKACFYFVFEVRCRLSTLHFLIGLVLIVGIVKYSVHLSHNLPLSLPHSESGKTPFMALLMGFCQVHNFQNPLRQIFLVYRICQTD